MTFKNIKSRESIVMQSLAKLAIEKGMIKPDVLEKKAESEPIGDSFAENLFALCNKLRSNGFSKYAHELESKFLMFKTAQYNVHKETGDDLIEFAHPDGSNKLDFNELGTIETQIDQHNKILDVIKKIPKGKLASKNAINAVKLVLSQNTSLNEEESLYEKNSVLIKRVNELWTIIDRDIKKNGNLNNGITGRGTRYAMHSIHITDTLKKPMTLDRLNYLSETLQEVWELIEPGPTGGVTIDVWDRFKDIYAALAPFFSELSKNLSRLNKITTSKNLGNYTSSNEEIKSENIPKTLDLQEIKAGEFASLFVQLNKLKNKIRSYTAVVSKYPSLIEFINGEIKDIDDLISDMKKVDESAEDELLPIMKKRVEDEEKAVREFYNKFIVGGG